MILRDMTLRNFRNAGDVSRSFGPGITVVIGRNASGKTNLLEAIMVLSTGKSFRAGKDAEMVRWSQERAIVSCNAMEGDDITTLEVMITRADEIRKTAAGKRFQVNGVPRRLMDFAGILRSVLFWPEDLEIVTDSPGIRRRYLDAVLSQADREYRRCIMSYERGLRQRNRLLDAINEGKAGRQQLLFWDQLLIRTGGYISDCRASYLTYVNGTAFSGHVFRTEYDKSVISDTRLAQYQSEEVAAKSTLVGPHRDDFRVMSGTHGEAYPDGLRNLAQYGSRGEQRLAVLWLKSAELSYIERETGSRPLLLLDDIFSELDDAHRLLICDIVRMQQTVITSADSAGVPDPIRHGGTVIQV